MESEAIKVYEGDGKGVWPDIDGRKVIYTADEVTSFPVDPKLVYILGPDSLEVAKTTSTPGETEDGPHVTIRVDLPDGSAL